MIRTITTYPADMSHIYHPAAPCRPHMTCPVDSTMLHRSAPILPWRPLLSSLSARIRRSGPSPVAHTIYLALVLLLLPTTHYTHQSKGKSTPKISSFGRSALAAATPLPHPPPPTALREREHTVRASTLLPSNYSAPEQLLRTTTEHAQSKRLTYKTRPPEVWKAAIRFEQLTKVWSCK